MAPILNNALASQQDGEGGVVAMSALIIPSSVKLEMPVLTRKYVELFCDRPELAFFTPLAFNLLLLLTCAALAFLTRRLPDAFNESWYIFLSVAATLFVWIAFLPTYFLASYAYHRGALLALALILNGYATNIVLFSPKLYALFYLSDDMVETSTFQFTGADPNGKLPARGVSVHRGGTTSGSQRHPKPPVRTVTE